MVMKAVFTALFLAFIASSASGQIITAGSLDVPTIIVNGKAEIEVEPDFAVISIDFTKTDKNLQAAQKANEDGVAKVLQLANRFAIPATDVSTNAISVSMKYLSIRDPQKRIFDEDGDEIGLKTFEGYEVSRSVMIKLSNLSKFQDLFDAILKTEPTEIESVSFQTTRLRELKDKAREMAMVAAREKAVGMTKAIGQTISKALKITENSNESTYSSANSANVTTTRLEPTVHVKKDALATFSPGTIKVEASVTVVFKLD